MEKNPSLSYIATKIMQNILAIWETGITSKLCECLNRLNIEKWNYCPVSGWIKIEKSSFIALFIRNLPVPFSVVFEPRFSSIGFVFSVNSGVRRYSENSYWSHFCGMFHIGHIGTTTWYRELYALDPIWFLCLYSSSSIEFFRNVFTSQCVSLSNKLDMIINMKLLSMGNTKW